VSDERVAKIEKLLTEAFQPSDLLVKDQSHLHAGHAGAQDGRGHFHGN
jgi:stress-induced morphogen